MYQDKIGEYAPLTIDNIIHTAENRYTSTLSLYAMGI